MEIVVFEDFKHHLYVAKRKDYDKMLKNHPQLKSKLCELITVYHADDYISLHQCLHLNGVFTDDV